MTKSELREYALGSKILSGWHYLNFHLTCYLRGGTHVFVEALFDALLEVKKISHDYAKTMIDRIASVGGRENYTPDYEQLLQLFAEIHVVAHIATYFRDTGYSITIEPGASQGLPNPEITVEAETWILAVEVKAPALEQLKAKRKDMDIQIMGRFHSSILEATAPEGRNVVLPRDNTIKDFLASANWKFESLPLYENKSRHNLLFIVWDDSIQEPVAALLSAQSGLFTTNSFAKDVGGQIQLYENTHAVVLLRHLHQVARALGGAMLVDEAQHAFDYGSYESLPPKALITNPFVRADLPPDILDAMQTTPIEKLDWLAEYAALDIVRWS